MTRFHNVKLELLRPGPTHNQLLSPLTPYVALCGNSAPVTLQINHEHHRFLSRLERLRYVVGQGQDVSAVPDRVREATVAEVGQDVAEILSKIPSLLTETSAARGEANAREAADERSFVHLSLVLGGSELALVPFEFAIAPQAHPGEGLEYCLQLAMPVVLTRETRRTLPPLPAWDARQPKVLVVAATPAGLDVPLPDHLQALRAALEPWIRWPRRAPHASTTVNDRDRLPCVKERMRVLANASIEMIEEACAQDTYTHVHVLAHGGEYELAGERRFGLVLHSARDPQRPEVVSGKRLAKALQTQSATGNGRSSPLVVTLATCDSGNTGSVLIPGGGIAHELHSQGIPWVFASQFPLTKDGSVRMTEALYPGLLRGDDPRQVLHEVRRQLYMGTQRNHDWGSLVAYATVPRDFEDRVATFFEQQTRRAIEVGLARADDLVRVDDPQPNGADANAGADAEFELERMLQRVRTLLDVWRGRLPDGAGPTERARRAECFGMHGSTLKRIALLQYTRRQEDKARPMMLNALARYRQAVAESASGSKYHWVLAQALSLGAVLAEPPDPATFDLAWHIARHSLLDTNESEQAWAHGTLAELELLSLHHKAATADVAQVEALVVEHCRRLVALMGAKSFHAESTRRQFQRYLDYWRGPWQVVAAAAVAALRTE